MTRAVGSNAVLKFCEESVWGTTPGSPSIVYGMPIKSETFGSTKSLFQSEMINEYRSVIGLGDGNRGVAGSFVSDMLPEGHEVLYRHLLGNPTVVTTGSGPYVHTMKGSAGYLPGLSIEKAFPNISQYFKFTGCRLNSMTLNLVQEGFHEVTWDMVGKNETLDTSTQIVGDGVFPTKNGFTGYECQIALKLADGGTYTDMGNIVSGSITINNNIETDGYVLGSAERASAEYGKRECNGNFQVFFEDATMYNYYVLGTEVGLKFTFTNLTGQIIVIEFPRCKLSGEAPKIASPGGLNLPMNFSARRDSVEGTDVIVTITNTIASF